MGRDWYWVSGSRSSSNSKRGFGGERDPSAATNGSSSSSSSSSTSSSRSNTHTATSPSGCMSAVFHFFDFHHFQFPLHHHQPHPSFKSTSVLPHEPNFLKGVEAPRNSLESTEEDSSSSTNKEEENLILPMGIQIKTSREEDTRSKVGSSNNDSSSEMSCSPGAKTPSLVARLMGLDLLPENSLSSSSSPSLVTLKTQIDQQSRPRQLRHGKPVTSHRNSVDGDITGIRSLPETPRISSARRSDVDHRLSLQLSKENMCVSEDLEFSRFSYLRRKEFKQDDENRSPRDYARQIVKQVKESVSRKVGMADITNTIKSREQARDHELVTQFRSKKNSRVLNTRTADESSPGKHSTPSCSPRLRFLESKNKPSTAAAPSPSLTKDHIIHQPSKSTIVQLLSPQANIQLQAVKSLVKPKLQQLQEQQQHHQQKTVKKCKKADSERFGSRLTKPPQTTDVIRNKQEEPFVRPSTATRSNVPDKKCKKTPLSNDLLNITVPSLLPVKKDPSPAITKLQVCDAQGSKRSSQLSSCSSQRYKQKGTKTHVAQDNNIDDRCKGAATTTTTSNAAAVKTSGSGAEHEYITRILKRTGIEKDTEVSFTNWFSPSYPLDPSIFYYLEHLPTSTCMVATENPSCQLRLRCNRKLLFQLVDEILVEIVKPYMSVKPWAKPLRRGYIIGSELVDKLCSRIRSFPCADCVVLEDIDALIDRDLTQTKPQCSTAFEEEAEKIVTEIEREIVDGLLHETTVEFGAGVRHGNGTVYCG